MIRLLHHKNDLDVLTTAWNWRYDAPTWFQESLDIFKESWEDFLESVPNELHYGVFSEKEPIAVIRLIEAYPYIFNIHLSAKRKTDVNVLLESGQMVRDYLFDNGVKGFYGYLPTQNKGIARLYEALNFQDTGIRCFKGKIHGKVVEWKHYALINPIENNVEIH